MRRVRADPVPGAALSVAPLPWLLPPHPDVRALSPWLLGERLAAAESRLLALAAPEPTAESPGPRTPLRSRWWWPW
jgi:hypothetical protein